MSHQPDKREPVAGTPPDPVADNPRTTPRHLVLRIAMLVVSGVAIYVLLPSVIKVVDAWPELSKASPVWLAAALGGEVVSFACNFALQRLVLRTKGWFAVVTAGLAGNALTNALPAGDAVGATLQFRMLTAAGVDMDTAAGGLTAASILGVGALFALPIFTLPVVLGSVRVQPGLLHTALIGLGGFVVFALLGFLVMTTDAPLARFGQGAQWLWNHLRRRGQPLTGLDRRLIEQRNQIRTALGRQWPAVLVLTAGRLGFDYLCLLCVLRAVGSHANPALVLLAYATAAVLSLIPVTPGGLGVVEASLSGMLVLAGVSAGAAVIATLGYRLAQYWLPLVAGAVGYLIFRRRYGRVNSAKPGYPKGPATS